MKKITSIADMDGRKIEKLFSAGKLSHLSGQRLTTVQIKQMQDALIPEMAEAGLLYTEPCTV